jgi:hypothetical protein
VEEAKIGERGISIGNTRRVSSGQRGHPDLWRRGGMQRGRLLLQSFQLVVREVYSLRRGCWGTWKNRKW